MSAATKRRKEIANQAMEAGVTPLEVMLTTMRELWTSALNEDGKLVNLGKAMQANAVAKDAAPYIHPKLSNVMANVDATVTEGPRIIEFTAPTGPDESDD